MTNLYDDITAMTDEQTAEACERAADILEGHWTTGEWYTEDSTENWYYCIEGAMAVAVGLDVSEIQVESTEREALFACPVYQAVLDTLNILMTREYRPELLGVEEWYGEGDLPNWNDNQAHGSEQKALDLLHATAKRMRGVEL